MRNESGAGNGGADGKQQGEETRIHEHARCSYCGTRETVLDRTGKVPFYRCARCGGELFILEKPTRIEDPGAARATT